MNRRTLVSFGAVAVLALVILLQNIKFTSDIPKLKQWAEPADEIEVKAKDYRLRAYMKDGAWVINDQAYPADENATGSLEMKVSDLKIKDLISEDGYYEKYELSEDKAVTVTVKRGGAVLRTLMIGKPGGNSNHSYVRVDGRKEIYLAAGIQREEFMQPLDGLRNKIVFDLKGKDVESFTIVTGGRTYSFYKKAAVDEKEGEGPKAVAAWYCKGYDKKPLDSTAISNLLYIFSPLRAVSYPEDKKENELGRIYATAVIRSKDAEYDLKIYTLKDDKENYYAVSSKSQYIFTMGPWQTEKIVIKNINDLMKK